MERLTTELRPHPLNERIYGQEQLPEPFLASVREKGILVPIAIKEDGTIISGHRRWRAALALKMESVPVQVVSYADDLDEREAVIEFNRQREKTVSQMMAEAEELDAIERERARRRQAHGQTAPGKNASGNVSLSDRGQARDKVAAAIGIGSGRTYEKARKVYQAAKAGDEVAQKALADLDAGKTTVHAAYKQVVKRQQVTQQEQALARRAPGTATIHHVDGIAYLESLPERSVDLLLTDPPYMTELEDVAAFARRWVPLALSRIKPTGRAYIFTGAYPLELHAYLGVLLEQRDFTLDNVLAWTYRNVIGPAPKMGYRLNWQACFYLYGPEAPPLHCDRLVEQFAVHDINAPDGRLGNRHHTWQKPDELAERLIRHSTREGQTVLDPFAGTGTFVLAAARLGRHGIGCEIDAAMLRIAESRGAVVRRAG